MQKHFEVREAALRANSNSHTLDQGKENEHNWAQRERAITRVRGMLKGDVHERFSEAFLAALKQGFIDASLKAVGHGWTSRARYCY